MILNITTSYNNLEKYRGHDLRENQEWQSMHWRAGRKIEKEKDNAIIF